MSRKAKHFSCSNQWVLVQKRNTANGQQEVKCFASIPTIYTRIRSTDLLEGLGWDSLHVRWAKLKSILMYKVVILNLMKIIRHV